MFNDTMYGYGTQAVPYHGTQGYTLPTNLSPSSFQMANLHMYPVAMPTQASFCDIKNTVNHGQMPNIQTTFPPVSSPPPSTAAPSDDDHVTITLDNKDLWDRFNTIGTEMIVTKPGRRMFPFVKVSCQKLSPTAKYVVLADVIPADNCRYKYQNTNWTVTGKGEPHASARMYVHPDSPAPGSFWMKKPISFNKMKITNNHNDKKGNIILNTMQKYQLRVHIVRANDTSSLNWGKFKTSSFDETKFISVTAYQSEECTKLKVDNNPFAKGFRDNRRTCFGGKRPSLDDKENQFLPGVYPEAKRQRIEPQVSSPELRILKDQDEMCPKYVTDHTHSFTTESRADAAVCSPDSSDFSTNHSPSSIETYASEYQGETPSPRNVAPSTDSLTYTNYNYNSVSERSSPSKELLIAPTTTVSHRNQTRQLEVSTPHQNQLYEQLVAGFGIPSISSLASPQGIPRAVDNTNSFDFKPAVFNFMGSSPTRNQPFICNPLNLSTKSESTNLQAASSDVLSPPKMQKPGAFDINLLPTPSAIDFLQNQDSNCSLGPFSVDYTNPYLRQNPSGQFDHLPIFAPPFYSTDLKMKPAIDF